ncbi:hypothetical protein GC093_06925 [Paenibacillus sp. LMG 31456]|uniref:Methyltransferase FkbM domain-containing protein n=1 Tax=Paenibacillus foliorum TaxID=2654974 RepID=A0A972GMF7_9BACL|nr:hypothetical protein [Paenibacillus foliorum]NOU92968.1 hypothetical protein [Paenibacillus foliorum]
MQKITLALSRAAATSQLRQIDETKPITWEFSGFSQNGEDGIIDFLTQKIINPNYYFIEVGASDGMENNTSWLAFGRKYEGIMFEGNVDSLIRLKQNVLPLILGVEGHHLFVSLENTDEIISKSLYSSPDFFSLDIDGNDYYIAKALLEKGFKPKIFAVEYNSAFGPNNSLTIKYDENFSIDFGNYENYLYYGVSIAAWKKLFELYGYKFVSVERRGVNAFFIDPSCFEGQFVESLDGIQFAENFYQLIKYKVSWEGQIFHLNNKELLKI